jgi:hypothetical protein
MEKGETQKQKDESPLNLKREKQENKNKINRTYWMNTYRL